MIIVYDTDTTGLPLHPSAPLSKQPRIIEFGAAILDDQGNVASDYNVLIHPGELITEEITRITGITNDDLRGAANFAEVLPHIRSLFEQADAVFAHNLPFDRAMLNFELARLGCVDFPWPATQICTVGLYRDLWGRNPKLTELYQSSIGKPLAQTHRALDDAMALVEIIQKEELWRSESYRS